MNKNYNEFFLKLLMKNKIFTFHATVSTRLGSSEEFHRLTKRYQPLAQIEIIVFCSIIVKWPMDPASAIVLRGCLTIIILYIEHTNL